MRILILAIGMLAAAVTPSCNHRRAYYLPQQDAARTKPYFFAYQMPAYPGPNDQLSCGIRFAIWPDGKTVRAASASHIGHAYTIGTMAAKDQAIIVQRINARPLFGSRDRDAAVVDASATLIGLRTDGGLETITISKRDARASILNELETEILGISLINAASVESPEFGKYPHDWLE